MYLVNIQAVEYHNCFEVILVILRLMNFGKDLEMVIVISDYELPLIQLGSLILGLNVLLNPLGKNEH